MLRCRAANYLCMGSHGGVKRDPLKMGGVGSYMMMDLKSFTRALTFSRSFLSNRRAITTRTKYNPNNRHTTNRTTKFLLRSAENTLSKSIGFGATMKSLANEVR